MTPNDGDARVRLRPLVPEDQDEFIAQARASTGLHHPWYTMPTTPEAFQTYLAKYSQPTAEGWLVCLRDRRALAGMITIDSIVRVRFQSATLSYAAFAPGRARHVRGTARVLRYAFWDCGCTGRGQHRARNQDRCGWSAGWGSEEGYSPAMLFFAGAWLDQRARVITRQRTAFLRSTRISPSLPA